MLSSTSGFRSHCAVTLNPPVQFWNVEKCNTLIATEKANFFLPTPWWHVGRTGGRASVILNLGATWKCLLNLCPCRFNSSLGWGAGLSIILKEDLKGWGVCGIVDYIQLAEDRNCVAPRPCEECDEFISGGLWRWCVLFRKKKNIFVLYP
jgi:hypothetical protein